MDGILVAISTLDTLGSISKSHNFSLYPGSTIRMRCVTSGVIELQIRIDLEIWKGVHHKFNY